MGNNNHTNQGNGIHPLVVIPLILVVVFAFPRFLVFKLGAGNPWTSYFYQYGFGLMIFIIGIWLILKTGACDCERERDCQWFIILLAGYVFFAVMHAAWIMLALSVPYLGGI
ncbi:MAG: hypothetical protein KJ626_08800 [Verrucomicrobia bacterium]|nr:hypothetical protein [Verrucomicrobiota bacterium]